MHFFRVLIFSIFLVLISLSVFAQIKLGDNRTVIQPGSLIELESTNRGLLNIRLNTTQMLSIPVSAASRGMMVYNIDSSCLCLYNGTVWRNMCKGQYLNQLKAVYIANTGDSTFICPSIITNDNHVQVFRNGVQVNFTATIGTNVLKLEPDAFCKKDDEIKIVQLINP